MKMIDTKFNRLDRVFIAVLLVLCLLVYAQVVSHGLNGLDDRTFLNHENVESGLTVKTFQWSLTTTHMAIWHPLTWWTYQIETSLFGHDNASARHIVNLLLHVLAVLICYLAMLRLFKVMLLTNETGAIKEYVPFASIGAFCVAFLFAFHPQHVQVIAWLSERKELLAALFSLLAFYAHIRGKLWLALIWFVVSLFSKASALPMAFVIIAYDVIIRWDDFWSLLKRRIFYYIGLLGFAISSAVMTLVSQTRLNIDSPNVEQLIGDSVGFQEWLAYIALNLGHYLKTLFLPWPLPIFVEKPIAIESSALGLSLLLIAMAVLFVILYRQNRWVLFGAVWFTLFWLPTSGIVDIGPFYVADRYMYQAHIGAFIMLVAAGITFLKLYRSNTLKLISTLFVIIVFIVTAYLSHLQTSYWEDNIKFYERELAVNPGSKRPYVMLGRDHQRLGNLEKSRFYYDSLLKRDPYDYYGNLYSAYQHMLDKNYTLAVEQFTIATQQVKLGEHHYLNRVYGGLAWSYWQLGKPNLAKRVAKRGLKLLPNDLYLLQFIKNKQSKNTNKLLNLNE